MKTYLYGFIVSVTSIIAVCVYVYLNAQQLLQTMKGLPTCFPPYFMMNQEVSHAPLGAYLVPTGLDDGLIIRAELCSVNDTHIEE